MSSPDSEPEVRYAEDVALALAVAEGDRAAATRLTRRLAPTVRLIARALAADPSDAEDASQIALLDVLRSISGYRGTGPLEGWARRVASRAVLRHVRRVRRGSATSIDDVQPPRAERMSTTVLESLPRPLEDYLAELPEVQRTSMILRHALGHSVPEIAELMDAPVPTVKSRIKKAHEELRRMIRRDLAIGVPANTRSR